MEISKEDREYIEANIVHFQQVDHDYLQGAEAKLGTYEAIYRRYCDGGFILLKWCPDCVLKMMKRLKYWWETNA